MSVGRVAFGASLLPLLAGPTSLALDPAAAAGDRGGTHLVVVLYPEDNDGRPGNHLTDRAVRSTFTAGWLGNVEVRSESLDVSSSPDGGYEQDMAEFLQKKYARRKVDLIIAHLAPALDFALKHREEIFPGAPVVFCAVEEREVKARALPPDVIGVPIKVDLAGTLDLALRLHPDTRHVFVVPGKAGYDAYWEGEARRTFRPYEERVEVVYLTGLPMDDLLGRVSRLPEDSIVYYLHVFQDGDGKMFIPSEVAELVAARANAPVYSHVGSYVGRGIVGGRVFSFETSGKAAAGLGLRLLAGDRPEDISVPEASENADVFDWRQLRKWGVGEGALPPGSDVRYVEPGFWDLYHWHVIAVVSLCVVEALLIARLLVQRASCSVETLGQCPASNHV